jgi:hypothetical protein
MTREDREEIARIFRVELQAALRSFTNPAKEALPPIVTDADRAKLAALQHRDKSRQKKALKGIYYE